VSEGLTLSLQEDSRHNQSLGVFGPWSPYSLIEAIDTFTFDQDFIHGELNAKYRLREAVPVMMEHLDDTYTVYWPEIETFGYGSSRDEAFIDLRNSVVELFERLGSEPLFSLGPQLRNELTYLENIIEYQ